MLFFFFMSKPPLLILNKDRYDNNSLFFRLFAELILIWFHFEKNFLATLRVLKKKSSSIFMAGQPSFESFWHEPNVQSNFAECIFCSHVLLTTYTSSIFTKTNLTRYLFLFLMYLEIHYIYTSIYIDLAWDLCVYYV